MSKYTTEVRFICEHLAGYSNSQDSNKIDEVIEKSWEKIFTSKANFFNPLYRPILCQKILKHYYFREICCETVGLWKTWMNTKLEEIMPYYNQLYKSELIEFDPMANIKLISKHETKTNVDSNGNSTSKNNRTDTQKDLYSDTPQGALTGVETEKYLTNARKIIETGDKTDETQYKDNQDSTENYNETITGKNSGESFSEMLNKYRETFINIDMMIINEFEELFFHLW